MIKSYVHNITNVKNVDYICNSANGRGPMGLGVAGAIKRAGGIQIQDEAYYRCKLKNYQPGDIYITNAGDLPYKKILHLITMKNPGGPTSLEIVKQCLLRLIKVCEIHNIKKIAIPALGTGVGMLPKSEVANIYIDILEPVEDIEFHVVDINHMFIEYVNDKLKQKRGEMVI
ncbi:MAG: macro domain-containing protein [archaeon]